MSLLRRSTDGYSHTAGDTGSGGTSHGGDRTAAALVTDVIRDTPARGRRERREWHV